MDKCAVSKHILENSHIWSTPKHKTRLLRITLEITAHTYRNRLASVPVSKSVCQSVNVLNLFDRTSRKHRSHGTRKYNKPEIHNFSFDGLLPFVNLQLGLHHIRTRLYSLPLNMPHDLYESTLTLHFADAASPEHRLQGIILDISTNRPFKAVRVCDY